MKSRIKQVAKFEFLRIVRTKGFIIALILAPVLMGAAIAITMYLAEQSNDHSKEEISIGVLSPVEDSSFAQIVKEVGQMGWKIEEKTSVDELHKMTLENKLKGYLKFDTANGIGYYSDKLSERFITNTLNGIVQNINRNREISQLGLDDSQVARLLNPEQLRTYKLSTDNAENAEAANANVEYGVRMICGIVLMAILSMCIMMFSLSVGRSVLEDKSSKIADVLLTSVKPEQLLAGKIIGISAASFLQTSVWIILALGSIKFANVEWLSGVFDFLTPSVLAVSVAFFIFGFVAATAIFASVGAMCETEQHFNRNSSYAIWLIMLPMFFLAPINENPDSMFSTVMSFIPIMSSSLMPLRMMGDIPTWQVIASFSILVIATVLLIKLAAKIFRNGIMQQGKDFGFKDMLKWLKTDK